MTRLLRPAVAAVVAIAVLVAGGLVLIIRASGDAGRRAPAAAATTTTTMPATTTTEPPATTTTIGLGAARLVDRLNAAMANTTGCLVVTDGASTLYADHPVGLYAPASTQKLLVAAAALSMLGPDYRFVTKVVAATPPKAGQAANLWLVGAGDALLATPDYIAYVAGQPRVAGYPFTPMAALASAVVAAGIKSVPGGIHGDDSRYERLRWLPAWPAYYQVQQDVGYLSALTVNEGIGQIKPVVKLAQDPPAAASSALSQLLAGQHVSAAAGADSKAPAGAVQVAQVVSYPLSQIVEAMLRASDNLIAELLVRELDRQAGGSGTTVGGLAVLVRQDAALGLPVGSAHLDDGSGLAPTDRVTCALELAALNLDRRPGLQAIGLGLAVAGQTGTLVHRFVGTPLAGKLAGKTGSIRDVAGLVAQVTLAAPLRFALLINQTGSDFVLMTKVDQVAKLIATYPA